MLKVEVPVEPQMTPIRSTPIIKDGMGIIRIRMQKKDMGNYFATHVEFPIPPELKALKDAILQAVVIGAAAFEPTKVNDMNPSLEFMQGRFGVISRCRLCLWLYCCSACLAMELDVNIPVDVWTGKTLLALLNAIANECVADMTIESLKRRGFLHEMSFRDRLEQRVKNIHSHITAMELKISAMQSLIARLQSTSAELQPNIVELQTPLVELQANIAEVKATYKELVDEMIANGLIGSAVVTSSSATETAGVSSGLIAEAPPAAAPC